MSSLPFGTCPNDRWVRAVECLRRARFQHQIMVDHGQPASDRDAATAAYVSAVDAMAEELGLLLDAGCLDEVGAFLLSVYGGRR